MTPERWKQVEELYLAASSREPEDRNALLAQTDPETRAIVVEMLAQRTRNQILDRPAWEDDLESLQERAAALESGTRIGPYRIEVLLGQGGMGTVYRAFDSRFGRQVAIKVLRPSVAREPEQLRQFEQEAWASGTLSHPNILTVYDVGTHEGTPYLVSELLSGKTLRDVLYLGPLTRDQALAHAHQIASALIAAHEKGIIHCDLKPENVFLTDDGRIKVLDFGLAKLSHAAPDSQEDGVREHSDWQEGLIRGTPGYMSPEQVRGEPLDHRSDVFNLGLILNEMLTGKRAIPRRNAVETLNAIAQGDLILPSGNPAIGPELTLFLSRCLEKNPGGRFQSAKDLTSGLEALRDRLSPKAPLGIKREWLVLAVLTAVAALTITLIALWPKPEPRFSPRLTLRLGNIAEGRFTPDGRNVVYSAAWEGRPMETYMTRADGHEEKSLDLPETGIMAISRTGDLALAVPCMLNWGECRGAIVRMPLSGKPLNEVVEVVEDGDSADWNPQGELAIVRPQNGHHRVEYPIGRVLYESPNGWISHLRFSPDGNRIAFLEHPDQDENVGSVEVIDLQGNRKTLATNRIGLKGLAWSPSGKELWFSATTTGRQPLLSAVDLDGREREIYQGGPGWIEILDIAADGKVLLVRQNPRAKLILDSPGEGKPRSLSWLDWSTSADISADGKTLLFYEWGDSTDRGQPVAFIRDTAGGDARMIGEGRPLALSPDQKWVIAVKKDPQAKLLLLPTGGSNPIDLPGHDFQIYNSAAWFPNGRRVVFVAERSDHIRRTYIQDVDGGPPRPIGGDELRAVLVSPRGTELAAYGPDGMFYRIPVEGGEFQPIPGTEPFDELTQWSADSNFIYVRGDGDSDVNIFRIDLRSGERKEWKHLEVPDKVGFVGLELRDGATRITPDGAFTVFTYWWAHGELYTVEGLK